MPLISGKNAGPDIKLLLSILKLRCQFEKLKYLIIQIFI